MNLKRPGALCYALISICLWPSKVAAAIVNGTIDDALGDSVTGSQVTYYPENVWSDQTCGDMCLISPNASQAFDRTYTAGIYAPAVDGFTEIGRGVSAVPIGINIEFTGTAIYVYFILSNLKNISTLNSADFAVDGNAPVFFATTMPELPNLTPKYNALVFSQTNLSNTLHTLNITTSGPVGPIYLNFDYAIYTYDNGASTTTSSLSSSSTETIMSPASSTPVTGAPARRTPIGAIAGGITGGITLFALVISLLLCWHRRGGHDTFQSVRGKGGSQFLITEFNGGAGNLAMSASSMPYTQPLKVRAESPMATATVPGAESSNTDQQANMRNNYQILHSGKVVLSPPGSQHLPSSSAKALPSSTSNSGVMVTSSINRGASPPLPSPLNATRTREEIRRVRQQDLDNRLRVVQHNIVQLEESSAGPERSVSLRRQTSGGAAIIEEEMHMSVPEMQEAIRSQREQIRVLREQQQSAWAQGLSDDPPPGYTPLEVDMQIPREASS